MTSVNGSILVPTDFQHPSLDALAMAQELGPRLGLEVILLHVYTVPAIIYPGFDPVPFLGMPEQVGRAARAALCELATASGNLRALLRVGDPAVETLKAIEDLQPTLVVMGTHGRRGFARVLLGSVAERVIRSSTVPVLTVHAGATEPGA